jgi:hypothetical protein
MFPSDFPRPGLVHGKGLFAVDVWFFPFLNELIIRATLLFFRFETLLARS